MVKNAYCMSMLKCLSYDYIMLLYPKLGFYPDTYPC